MTEREIYLGRGTFARVDSDLVWLRQTIGYPIYLDARMIFALVRYTAEAGLLNFKPEGTKDMSDLTKWLHNHGIMRADHNLPSPLATGPAAVNVPESASDGTPSVSEKEIEAGNAAIRKVLDASGYGGFVSNEESTSLATAVLVAAAEVRE